MLVLMDSKLGFFNCNNVCVYIVRRLADLAKFSLLFFRKKLVLSELHIFGACSLIAWIGVIKSLNLGISYGPKSIPTFFRNGRLLVFRFDFSIALWSLSSWLHRAAGFVRSLDKGLLIFWDIIWSRNSWLYRASIFKSIDGKWFSGMKFIVFCFHIQESIQFV